MPAAPESEYREQAPPPALAPWALCAWTWRAGPAGRAQRVVPDGCVDLVWIDGHADQAHFSGPVGRVAAQLALADPELVCGVAPPGDRPANVELCTPL